MLRYISLYKYKLVTLEKQNCLRKPPLVQRISITKIHLAKPLKHFSFLMKRNRSACVRYASCKNSQKGSCPLLWGGKVQGWTEDRMTDTTTLNINIPSLASKTSRRDNLAFLAHNNNSPSHQVPHQNQVYT